MIRLLALGMISLIGFAIIVHIAGFIIIISMAMQSMAR